MGCHVLNRPLTLMDPLLEQALYQPEGPQSHNSSLQLKGPLWQITMPFSSSPFPVLDLPTPPLTQPWCAWKGRQLDPSLSPTGGHPTNGTAQQQQDGGNSQPHGVQQCPAGPSALESDSEYKCLSLPLPMPPGSVPALRPG